MGSEPFSAEEWERARNRSWSDTDCARIEETIDDLRARLAAAQEATLTQADELRNLRTENARLSSIEERMRRSDYLRFRAEAEIERKGGGGDETYEDPK